MRVLVSGASGLVGRYIVETLLGRGHEILAGGRHRPEAERFHASLGFVPLYLDPGRDQSAAFAGVDAFVHCAFHHVPGRYRGGEGDDAPGFVSANLDGSIRLFETARQSGVRRVVFLSSRAVYDGLSSDGGALGEDMACAPTSLYGEVKLKAEQALEALCRPGFVGTSLRLTGVYGDLMPNKWQGLFADYLAGRPVPPRAGSEVHGRDVGEAVRLIIEHDEEAVTGRVFNVSDIVTDHREILDIFRVAGNSDNPLPDAADANAVAEMDTSRLRALGWRPGGRELLRWTVQRLAVEPS